MTQKTIMDAEDARNQNSGLRTQKSEFRIQNSEVGAHNARLLRRWEILVHLVAAKGSAHFQFTNLNRTRSRTGGIRVELGAVFVGETEERVRHGLAGADCADLQALERPSDVNP